MLYYTIFGIDENGLAYSFSNETQDWALRGARSSSQCFGLCEMSSHAGERSRVAVRYAWNPIDGYQFDPCGDIAKAYDDTSATQMRI